MTASRIEMGRMPARGSGSNPRAAGPTNHQHKMWTRVFKALAKIPDKNNSNLNGDAIDGNLISGQVVDLKRFKSYLNSESSFKVNHFFS